MKIIRRIWAFIFITPLIVLKAMLFIVVVIAASLIEYLISVWGLLSEEYLSCDDRWIRVSYKDILTLKDKLIDVISSVLCFVS